MNGARYFVAGNADVLVADDRLKWLWRKRKTQSGFEKPWKPDLTFKASRLHHVLSCKNCWLQTRILARNQAPSSSNWATCFSTKTIEDILLSQWLISGALGWDSKPGKPLHLLSKCCRYHVHVARSWPPAKPLAAPSPGRHKDYDMKWNDMEVDMVWLYIFYMTLYIDMFKKIDNVVILYASLCRILWTTGTFEDVKLWVWSLKFRNLQCLSKGPCWASRWAECDLL